MYLQIFIAILSAALVTFGLGFAAGHQRGEQSITTQMKYLLLQEHISRLKLAVLNMHIALARAGVEVPDLNSYEYGFEEPAQEDSEDTSVPPLPEYAQLNPTLAEKASTYMKTYVKTYKEYMESEEAV